MLYQYLKKVEKIKHIHGNENDKVEVSKIKQKKIKWTKMFKRYYRRLCIIYTYIHVLFMYTLVHAGNMPS